MIGRTVSDAAAEALRGLGDYQKTRIGAKGFRGRSFGCKP
jgi:hypothetical protein